MRPWASLLRRERRDLRSPTGVGGRGRAARLGAAALLVASAMGLGAEGCIYTSDEGLNPPLRNFYYPTGLVVSPGRRTLYVVNSDFDLQYNGGTIQAVDLDSLRPQLEKLVEGFRQGKSAVTACASIGLLPNGSCTLAPPSVCTNDILNPGPCSPIVGALDNPLVKSFGTVGAFASGAIYVPREDGSPGARLFAPVRGDPSITFFDVDDDRDPEHIYHPCGHDFCLDCGGVGFEKRCDDAHKLGEDPFENTRFLTLPTDPVGIAASDDGSALVSAHDSANAVSLSTNDWFTRPALQFTLPDLPTGPTEVASIPIPAYAVEELAHPPDPANPFNYQPGFLVTYRAFAALDLMRVSTDQQASPPRPYLQEAAQVGITANADGKDSRGIAIDPTARRECESACKKGDGACLVNCMYTPMPMFIANRAPASLLLGEVDTTPIISNDLPATGAYDTMQVYDSIPLDQGPSHVSIGKVIDLTGKLVTRVFVVCFDSRFVFIYNPTSYAIEATIRTGRGPQAMAFDTDKDHSYLIVAHFTDSYLGVVDLDMRDPTFGTMFATIGEPLPPRESK